MIDIEKDLPFKCKLIKWSDDGCRCTLYVLEKGYCVIDSAGKTIVDFGIYQSIDGFTHGYAKVKQKSKYGIIDYFGRIVLPNDYIWNFYKKTYPFVIAYKYSKEYKKHRYKKELYELLIDGKITKFDKALNHTFWLVSQEERKAYYKKASHYSNENGDGIDYKRLTWDAMTDGMYDDMPDGFGGDYDFMG